LIFYHSSWKTMRRWKKNFSIDKWNNNLRLQEKNLKFSFKNKLKKYSWILNLQEKKNTFPLINVLIIILDHKTFYFLSKGPRYIWRQICWVARLYMQYFEQVTHWNGWSKQEMATQLSMSLRGTTQRALSDITSDLWVNLRGLNSPNLKDSVHQREKPHFAIIRRFDWYGLILLCLTPLSAIFQLYHGDQF